MAKKVIKKIIESTKKSKGVTIQFGDKDSVTVSSTNLSKVNVRANLGEDTVLLTLSGKVNKIE